MIYTVEIERTSVPFKHSAHEKLFLHVIDETVSGAVMKDESLLLSSMNLSEPIKLSDSTLMFSKKPLDKDNFFIGESMAKKPSEKEEILLENDKLISSPR